MEGDRQEINGEKERDGEGGHSARVMVADMGVQPAVKGSS